MENEKKLIEMDIEEVFQGNKEPIKPLMMCTCYCHGSGFSDSHGMNEHKVEHKVY